MEIYFAPIQGITDNIYRNAHNQFFEGVNKYFTPFMRVENGQVRKKDIVDLQLSQNPQNVVPQIIASDKNEIRLLLKTIIDCGYDNCNLNFGCPYPQQIHKNKGAGILSQPEKVAEVFETLKEFSTIKFSLKMRIGMYTVQESLSIVNLINDAPLSYVIIHPRLGTQMYSGDLDFETFQLLKSKINHPVVFNGEIKTLEDYITITAQNSNLQAVMIGRGLVANPFLAEQILNNNPHLFDKTRYFSFVETLIDNYTAKLGSEAMTLKKLKEIWQYPPISISDKTIKSFTKSRTIAEFLSNLAISCKIL